MPVYAVWESYFPSEAAAEGQAVTNAIWEDMRHFDGYVSHELIADLDDPGHLLVVGQWTTRERADEIVKEYSDLPNARRANELVSRPRTRFLGQALKTGE